MKKKLGLRRFNVSLLIESAEKDIIYSRDIERGIRPEIGSCYPESLLDLVRSRGTVVLDVAGLGLDIVGVEVCDGGDIRVSDLAVIALIVVIG